VKRLIEDNDMLGIGKFLDQGKRRSVHHSE